MRVCMVTLTDACDDLRIRKEAESATKRHSVFAVCPATANSVTPFPCHGFEVHPVRIRSRRLPKSPIFWAIKYAEFLVRATWTAVRRRAVIYHGHDITGAFPAYLAARLTRAKFVYDAHELEADRAGPLEKSRWLRSLQLFFLRRLLRRADHVICASESRADIMLAEYGVRERPTPILNVTPRAGMPELSGEIRLPNGVGLNGKKVVLYQGTLAPGRGLDRVVAALARLDESIVLMILGDGGTFHDLIRQSDREGTRGRLIMVGRVPADSLVAYMRLAHVGLAIYRNVCRNNYYCAPNKVFEYASVGLPVVGPNFPDVEKLLRESGIGRTFDPEDSTSIADAIRDVLSSPQRYQSMRAAALALKETVNWEREEEKLLSIYARLVPSNAKA